MVSNLNLLIKLYYLQEGCDETSPAFISSSFICPNVDAFTCPKIATFLDM